MKVLITGGAGFIGRWTIKKFLEAKHDVWVLDNLSNGFEKNIEKFKRNKFFKKLIKKDITNNSVINDLFRKNKFEICIHLAAQIEVQDSLENPRKSFEVNCLGTFNLLEASRHDMTKFIFVSTCMVYDAGLTKKAISEDYPVKPKSPYALSKLMGEEMVFSYFESFGLPVVILRPFNTYGPFQRSDAEGGVISIFIKNSLNKKPLKIYGDGKQTRDFLYVEDCADFITKASFSKKAIGEIINAGSGKDVSINELALKIGHKKDIIHVPHHHQEAEIRKLVCNYAKVSRMLNWKPKVKLEEGLRKTRAWIKENN